MLYSISFTIFNLLALLSPFVSSQKCRGQSCKLADLSGSTGIVFDPNTEPKLIGGSIPGNRCIEKYLTQFGLPIIGGKYPPPPFPRVSTSKVRIKGRQATTCKPYTLIYVPATGETGPLGQMVGPMLQYGLNNAMPGSWDIKGVAYDNSMEGNDCVGIPGGITCMEELSRHVQACPSTKVIVGGYSQGAMAAHSCVGYAPDAVKKHVEGIVVFGDPFNGAPIRGFPSEKVKTFCHKEDTVCDGLYTTGWAHYIYDIQSTPEAIKWIQQTVTK